MYQTPPPNMVNTQSTVRKQELLQEEEQNQRTLRGLPRKDLAKQEVMDEEQVQGKGERVQVRKKLFDHVEPGTSANINNEPIVAPSTSSVTRNSKSKKSSSTSVLVRKKRLELEAAEAKARIEMELIDKKLQADIAALEEEYSSQSEEHEVRTNCDVEGWLERSQHEQTAQPVQQDGFSLGELCPPAANSGGTDGTVQMLASALKDLATVSRNNAPNANLLSRISTPKDLPIFAGNPMDWLQFKQAYEESTQVCNFSPRENLWRLRGCLRGPAKEAVTALLISATSPDIVMSTLELQFGNPDLIITSIMQDVKKLPAMSHEYHKDIVTFSVKVKNFVAAVLAIGQDEYLKSMNIMSAVLSKLPTVLLAKWTDYSYPLITNGSKPKLVILSDFLTEEAIKTTKTAVNINCIRNDYNFYKRKYPESYAVKTHNVLLQDETSARDTKCRFCHASSKHKLPECKKFKKALRKDRWRHVKRYALCYKCLLSRHDRNTCPAPACNKNNCGQLHHPLLHYDLRDTQDESNTGTPEPNTETQQITHINDYKRQILLKVVTVQIHGPRGTETTAALLDDGSTVTLINSELAARVGLCGYKKTLRVCGAWDNNALECDSEIINLTVTNRDGQLFTFSANSVKNLNLPAQDTSTMCLTKYRHLIEMQDKINLQHCKPQMLIGQDNYHLLLPLQVIEGQPGEPYATLTPLGWCLHGCSRRLPEPYLHSTLLLSVSNCELNINNEHLLSEIHEEVKRSFAIDSLGVSIKARENSEDLRAHAHLERTSKLINGRWHVGLPWKDCSAKMPNSFTYAITRLKGIENKIKANEGYAARYRERIDHLFQNDYAKEITNISLNSKTWYLPHFGVDNPNKQKLRLVFDAAAKCQGLSLNDYLLKGPDLLVSLLGIMMRFREHRIGIMGDIKDMFLRIKILPEDQDALRFLWRDNPTEKLKICAMTSLIFGANCSPFIAQFIKNRNAQRYESSYPVAVRAICEQHYMDDYIDSVENIQTAKQLIKDIAFIHGQGGFEIRNWTSNCEEILSSIPTSTLGPTAVKFNIEQQFERTLGLMWFPKKDTLGFDVSFKRISANIVSGEKRPTKREMLRVIMSIFDVFGFLSPFTIKGKIILQNTWQSGISWDESLPDELYNKWTEWLKLLKSINCVSLPRYYQAATRSSETENAPSAPNSIDAGDYAMLELHVFCDASTQAMCAVAYWRWVNNNKSCVAFIASKCRVAPVKQISVPRLELQAAVLGSRLAATIIEQHKIKPQRKYFWSDSTTVLHWIKDSTRNYQSFVAHRLGEIDELTCASDWRYVPTKLNIADAATREICDIAIFSGEWLYGPSFLYCNECNWPENVLTATSLSRVNTECVAVIKNTPQILPACPDPERFSSWLRLLRSACIVLSFVDKKYKKLTGEIDIAMMLRAEYLLIRYAQIQSFHEDLAHLEKENMLDQKSKLLTLSPFLDEHGILRVGGRVDAAPGIAKETKQPIILHGRHHIARLIIMHYHKKYAHGNHETVVNEIRQKFWIIRIRPTVRNVVSKCMLCRIRKAQPQPPRMGNLPQARLAHHQRPFTFCGLDLFGPMKITIGRRHEIRYGVLFTCMTVRAIHIEMVSTLTTDSLIMALRRMAARRGWPQQLFSDNGTNLRGADNELKNSVKALNQEVLKKEAVNYGTIWSFIPPLSPHWGGAWERLIRTVKTSLKVVLKERAPKEEVLITLMAEVEQIVNSRPLSHVSVEPATSEAITPNHFLLGTSSNLPVLGAFDDSDLFLRRQWRISQRLADQFWRRWLKEVLPTLLPRRRWQEDCETLKVGDLVFIVDPNMPRGVWPRGIIDAVLPGSDGRVRVVDVRTKSGLLRRSAVRVAKLPVEDKC